MAGGFVFCEYETVRQGFAPFQRILAECRTQLISEAMAKWSPKTFGGMTPRSDQIGETPIMPECFRSGANATPATTTLTSWRQRITATGHQIIMSGANGGNIYEDYMMGLCGLVFLDKAIRVSEIKMQVSDRKLPRVNIEEMMAYNKPAIVFEDYFLLDEETGFDLYAYVLTRGYQRIKLLGPQMNRVPNKLQTTNTGAALV